MDNTVKVISVDKSLAHMYGTLTTYLGSFSTIYFYDFPFQLDFIDLMAWEMIMGNNNSELTSQCYLLFDWFS